MRNPEPPDSRGRGLALGAISVGDIVGNATVAIGHGATAISNVYHEFLAPSDAQRRRNRQTMLARVRQVWIAGVLARTQAETGTLTPALAARPDFASREWSALQQQADATPVPADAPLLAQFDASSGALLILGAPGSGKSMLLLTLARELLDRAAHDESQPIPVVLSLASWPARAPSLDAWLADELHARYDIPRQVAAQWVEQDELLPLLDGLDEVTDERRAGCARAINSYRSSRLAGMAVCCRLGEYEQLEARLDVGHALEVCPLSDEQIDAYLAEHAGSGALRKVLAEHDALREFARSPLTLTLLAATYADKDSEALAALERSPSPHSQLFERYIARMFAHRGEAPYTPEQTRRGLAWLAEAMARHNQSSFLIDRMQPSWLRPGPQQRTYRTGVLLVVGAVVAIILGGFAGWLSGSVGLGLLFGPLAGLLFALAWERGGRIAVPWTQGWSLALAEGLTYGLLYAVVKRWPDGLGHGAPQAWAYFLPTVLIPGLMCAVGCGFVRAGRIEPVEALRWSWRAALSRGLPVGLLVGVLTGLFAFGPSAAVGLALGLATLLTLGLTPRAEIDARLRPNSAIWRSLRNALRWGLLSGLSFGLAVGLSLTLKDDLRTGLRNGLGYGLTAALVLGMVFGGLACLQHLWLRRLLAWAGVAPWNYRRFLDHADDRILLRRVGGGYEFVHRLLLEHFAAQAEGFRAEEEAAFARAARQRLLWAATTAAALLVLALGGLGASTLLAGRAEARADSETQALLAEAQQRGRALILDGAGALPHNDDGQIEMAGPAGGARDLVAEATFENPYARAWTGNWDYGLVFREAEGAGATEEYQLVLRASGLWELRFVRYPDPAERSLLDRFSGRGNLFSTIARGRLRGIDTRPGATNTLRLAASGAAGYFYLNERYVATLDLAQHQRAGRVLVASGLNGGSERPPAATRYSDFRVWALDE
jgi:eukaryotic-like serine/threonine-protein kinase